MPEHLWRPFDQSCIADPYPMYQRLRDQEPVHQSQTGEWIITQYDDIRSILTSQQFLVGNRLQWLQKGIEYFNYKQLDFEAIQKALDHFILFLNPPDHGRIRKFIHSVWTERSVHSVIEENVDQLIRQITKAGPTFDLISSFSKPLPALTITRILGLPVGDYPYLKELGSHMIKALDLYITLRDIKQINKASGAFLHYFEKTIVEKRQRPDQGLISKLIQANDQRHVLSEEELLSSCILLFIAGEETSLGLTGTGLMNLIRHRDQWQQLRDEPTLIEPAIHELIRYDAPVQIVGRIASSDTMVAGKHIKEGSALTLCIGSGNRDPLKFDQPDVLNFTRTDNRHLGFGAGAHYCMGDWLALLQTKIAIEKILQAFTDLEITDSNLQWNQNLAIRSLNTLPVKYTKR